MLMSTSGLGTACEGDSTMKRDLYIGLSFVAVLGTLGAGSYWLDHKSVAHAATTMAPRFEVDPLWPKPLPNHWLLGQTIGVSVDAQDHVWIIHRSSATLANNEKPLEMKTGECCQGAPPVLEFDQQGNLLNAWGNPTYHEGWPPAGNIHAIVVDKQHNVWISGSGRGNSIQKYTRDGKFLWDFGHRGPKVPAAQVKQNNQQTDIFPPGIGSFELDEDAREIFISDGFLNKRILVYDMDTGAFKRGWGGHGIPLSEIDNDPTPDYDISGPPPDQKQFAPALHCVHFSRDGLVYVCERGMNRIQVFTKQGKFVTSFQVAPNTPSRGEICDPRKFGMCGSTYNLTFSHDADQKYVFIADGTNDKVWIQDRKTGAVAGSIGDNGRMAGYFHWIDAIAVDCIIGIWHDERVTPQPVIVDLAFELDVRRAARDGYELGLHEPFLFAMVDLVGKQMGDQYPEVRDNAAPTILNNLFSNLSQGVSVDGSSRYDGAGNTYPQYLASCWQNGQWLLFGLHAGAVAQITCGRSSIQSSGGRSCRWGSGSY